MAIKINKTIPSLNVHQSHTSHNASFIITKQIQTLTGLCQNNWMFSPKLVSNYISM